MEKAGGQLPNETRTNVASLSESFYLQNNEKQWEKEAVVNVYLHKSDFNSQLGLQIKPQN